MRIRVDASNESGQLSVIGKLSAAAIAVTLSAMSLSDKLPAPIDLLLILIYIAVVLYYVRASHRKTSVAGSTELIPLFSKSFRKLAGVLLATDVAALIGIWPPYTYVHYHSPQLTALSPVPLVAGENVTIAGQHFNTLPSRLRLVVGGVPVSKYISVQSRRLEVQVPQDSVSGPVVLSNLGLLTLSATYPWVELLPVTPLMKLVAERITNSKEGSNIYFSVLNADESRSVVVYDITVNVIRFADEREVPEFAYDTAPRVQLGVIAVFDQFDHGIAGSATLKTGVGNTISLLSNFAISLRPHQVKPLSIRIVNPGGQRSASAVLSMICRFYDEKGERRQCRADRLYLVRYERGELSAREFEWSADTWERLRRWFPLTESRLSSE